MNRRLRIRHRRVTTGFAIGVPVALAAAIIARPSMPVLQQLPDLGGSGTDAGYGTTVASETVQIENAVMRFRLLRTPSMPARYAVEVRPQSGSAVRGADVLVYWTDVPASSGGGAVPAGSQLVGTLAGPQSRRYPLPTAAGPGQGRLVFYSLGQQRLIAAGWVLPAEGPSP